MLTHIKCRWRRGDILRSGRKTCAVFRRSSNWRTLSASLSMSGFLSSSSLLSLNSLSALFTSCSRQRLAKHSFNRASSLEPGDVSGETDRESKWGSVSGLFSSDFVPGIGGVTLAWIQRAQQRVPHHHSQYTLASTPRITAALKSSLRRVNEPPGCYKSKQSQTQPFYTSQDCLARG